MTFSWDMFLPYLAWGFTVVCAFVGLAGVIIPIVPGTTLILLGMVVHKLLMPVDLSWWAIAWIAGFWFLSVVADFAGVLIGTKLFGGTKWGMAGASGGALIGMFFSLPALFLGTICGAIVTEKYVAKKTGQESLRAGAGAATGFVISTFARLLCAGAMILLFLAAVFG